MVPVCVSLLLMSSSMSAFGSTMLLGLQHILCTYLSACTLLKSSSCAAIIDESAPVLSVALSSSVTSIV